MAIHDRRRTKPAAARAYTVPVVREVPVRPSGYAASGSREPGQPLAGAADPHAW
jgi:hypothetical protein